MLAASAERRRRVADRELLAALVLVMASMVFLIPMVVSVVVPVPVMVMLTPTPIAVPVTRKVPLSIVMRLHPSSPRIRWPSPITFMPMVMFFTRIPITGYPHELRTWTWSHNVDHIGRRWRADIDSNGDFSTEH